MKKLTFKRQINLGIVLVVLGHLIAAFTKLNFFSNLGFIAFGLLFLVNPVSPYTSSSKQIELKLRITGIVIILFGMMVRFRF